MQPLRLTPMLCAALMLCACGGGDTSNDERVGDGSSSNPVFSDGNGTDDEGGTEESGTGDESGTDDDAGPATDEGPTTAQDADGGSDLDDDVDGGRGNGTDDGAGNGTGDGIDVGTGGGPDGDGAAPGTGAADIVQPGIPGNLSATRLILGTERVLKATLLDLNARHASGSPLSEQQQACLGSHDPALGEAAFALDCDRPLATVEVDVERGAFYRTADCAADLAAGTADRCVMESARITMRTRFAVPPGQEGQGRPRPVPGSGVVVGYAIGEPLLTLRNDERSPLQPFDCAFELQNGALLPSIGGREVCDAQVRGAADLIDFLSPAPL